MRLIYGDNDERVLEYLGRYPDLTGIVFCLLRDVRAEVPAVKEMELRLEDDGDEYLCLLVRAEEYPLDFMGHIEKVRRRYYRRISKSDGWLHLTTDFQ